MSSSYAFTIQTSEGGDATVLATYAFTIVTDDDAPSADPVIAAALAPTIVSPGNGATTPQVVAPTALIRQVFGPGAAPEGDVTGASYTSPLTVAGLQGRPLSASAPSSNQAYLWDASASPPQWEPTSITAAIAGADPAGSAATAQTAAESYADTNKLAKSANLSDLASAPTARTNLGLGTAATQPSSAFDVSGAATAAAALRVEFVGAWQPSTLYGVNQAVTWLGGYYVCQTAHTSGSSLLVNWPDWDHPGGVATRVVDVTDFGADPTGTNACDAAIAAARTYGATIGPNYALHFPHVGGSGTYVIESASSILFNNSSQTAQQLVPHILGAPAGAMPGAYTWTPGLNPSPDSVVLVAGSSFPVGERLIDYVGNNSYAVCGGLVQGVTLYCNGRASGLRIADGQHMRVRGVQVIDAAAPNPSGTYGPVVNAAADTGAVVDCVSGTGSPNFPDWNNLFEDVFVITAAGDGICLEPGSGGMDVAINCHAYTVGNQSTSAPAGTGVILGDRVKAWGLHVAEATAANLKIGGSTVSGWYTQKCLAGPEVIIAQGSGTSHPTVLTGGSAQGTPTTSPALSAEAGAMLQILSGGAGIVVTGNAWQAGAGTTQWLYVGPSSNVTGTAYFDANVGDTSQYTPAGAMNLNSNANVRIGRNPGINGGSAPIAAFSTTDYYAPSSLVTYLGAVWVGGGGFGSALGAPGVNNADWTPLTPVDAGAWANGRSWPLNVIVTYDGVSYLSIQLVTNLVGAPPANPSYWLPLGVLPSSVVTRNTSTLPVTFAAGETTVLTGSTSGGTGSLPQAPGDGTRQLISNYSSVSVTLAPSSGDSMNFFGTSGDYTLTSEQWTLWEYQASSTTWDCVGIGQVGGSGVASVTAGSSAIVIGGSGANPTVDTASLDVIATDHATAGNVAMNGHKVTGLAVGTASTDAATVGQVAAAAVKGRATPAAGAITNSSGIQYFGFGGDGAGGGANPCTYTPSTTGKVTVSIKGYITTSAGTPILTYQGAYGTGTAPLENATSNPAGYIGTFDLSQQQKNYASGDPQYIEIEDDIDLSAHIGTACWFDVFGVLSAAETVTWHSVLFRIREG